MIRKRHVEDVLCEMQRQLGLAPRPYISLALEEGHGLNIILFLSPEGRLGEPKITVDTRGEKR